MFEFKNDKAKENEKQKAKEKEKLRMGALSFLAIGVILILVGIALIIPAFAVNMTAINEINAELNPNLNYDNTFSVFWIVFLLILLAVFMAVSIIRHEDREMVFFSIGAVIVSFMITLLFISPISFDYITQDQKIIIEEVKYPDGSITYNSGFTNSTQLIQVIPPDSDFRMSLSLLFTGVALFNGFYSIMILTQFSTKGKFG